MDYLVLGYADKKVGCTRRNSSSCLECMNKLCELLKHTRLFRKYELYIQYRQFVPQKMEVEYETGRILYVNLPDNMRIFSEMSARRMEKFRERYLPEKGMYKVLAVQQGLEPFLPDDAKWAEDVEEFYIILVKNYMNQLLEKQCIHPGKARMLIIDDGTKDVVRYVRELTGSWNYVTVCSNRHEQLDEIYRELYEEDGLMVSCLALSPNADPNGDLVIDLTASWKGLHRIYPENAYVLDVTFSREKREYLRAKHVNVKDYVQVVCADVDARNFLYR